MTVAATSICPGRARAFSCKCRGCCPSCGARHVVETSAHLIDHVLPAVPRDDDIEQALHAGAGRCADFMEARRLSVPRVDPVQRDHMKVQIDIDRAAKALNERDDTPAGTALPRQAGASDQRASGQIRPQLEPSSRPRPIKLVGGKYARVPPGLDERERLRARCISQSHWCAKIYPGT